MNKNFRLSSTFRFFAVSCLVLSAIQFSVDTHAARQKEGTRATGAIDAKTFKILTKAQELTEAGKFSEAIQTLDKVRDNSNLNSYAKSQIWNFYAFIYASQEKYKDAIEAYKNILAEKEATEGLKLTAKYTMAQLYFQIEDYKSVIELMEQWLKEINKPTSTAHIMLAQAYYQRKSYDPALKNLVKAIAIARQEGKQIKENWLRMKAAIYYEKEDTKNTLQAYEELMANYPRTSYLKQIAGLHGELGDERKRLTTYDAAYLHGALQKEGELLNLSYMYLGQKIPYKASQIIETNMKDGHIKSSPKNIETLANSWAHANEHKKAIPALEKAAGISDKGLLYARLAGVYFDAGNYKKAAEAAKRADVKGGLKQRGNNQMLMGMSYFNIKEFENALQAFRQAKQAKNNFDDARKWEKYTLTELERLRIIKESKLELADKTRKAIEANETDVNEIGSNLLQDSANGPVHNTKQVEAGK